MFVPSNPFQSSLIFASKAGAYLSGAPFSYSLMGYAPGVTRQYIIQGWEIFARDKHSNIIDVLKSFIILTSWTQCNKTLISVIYECS